MAKARKNAASALSSPQPRSTQPETNMNIGEYEDDDNDDNDKRSRGQLRWRKLVKLANAVQYILRVATSTKLTLAAIASILANLFVDDEELQSTLIKYGVGYLCILRPLLSTLAIVCCDLHLGEANNDNNSKSTQKGPGAMTRIIALSFLMSIICNQLPKWLSAFVACCAVFAFGLASRQLVPHHHHQLQSQSTDPQSEKEITTITNTKATKRNNNEEDSNNNNNIFQRMWSRLGLKERAALGAIALVASLLIENFLIWVVSATFRPGIDGTPDPLQDNGRIVLEKLAMKVYNVAKPWMAKRKLQSLRDGLNVQWALVSSLGASFVCLELQLGRQQQHSTTTNTTTQQKQTQRTLAGLALRALITLSSARIIRTISFVLTVLPSQVPNCYARHFPPPPAEWTEWLMVGFLPNSRGGCNDLILSGHATVTSTIGCAFTSAAANTSFSIAVWTLIALDYSIEAYQGLHYSVDMWLGCIVTCLLWQLTKPLEFGAVGASASSPSDNQQSLSQHAESKSGKNGSEMRPLPPPLNATIIAMYAVPAALAFVILTVVPEAYVNYFLVLYSGWAGAIVVRYGFTNFVQHVFLCELCFGLGAYL